MLQKTCDHLVENKNEQKLVKLYFLGTEKKLNKTKTKKA